MDAAEKQQIIDNTIIEYIQETQKWINLKENSLIEMISQNIFHTKEGKTANISTKTFERYLTNLTNRGVLKSKKMGKSNSWILIDDKNVILDECSRGDAFAFSLAETLVEDDFSPEIIDNLKKIFTSNSMTLMGYLSISEDLKNKKLADKYNILTKSIKNRDYLSIDMTYPNKKFNDVKPIRLLFLDNNWYLAFEYFDLEQKSKNFRLGRVAFIDKIEFSKDNIYSNKKTFQKKDLDQYIEFLKNIQNAMTLYDVEAKTAKIKAIPFIAKYFKEDMKKFLSSQKFIEELDDGSVIFTVKYTQPLEILPFIQKWLPDLIILEPQELKDAYVDKLKRSINNYTRN